MIVDQHDPVRTFVLLPERDLGHAIADKLREDPAIHVIGVSTDADKDAYWIYEADPDVIVADFQAGGLEFLFTERLPPGDHRVVFFAPRSDEGCEACYQALVHGAEGIMCRPGSTDEASHSDALIESVGYGIQSIQPKPREVDARYKSTSRIVETESHQSVSIAVLDHFFDNLFIGLPLYPLGIRGRLHLYGSVRLNRFRTR